MKIPRQSSKLGLPLLVAMTVAMGASVAVAPMSAATAEPASRATY